MGTIKKSEENIVQSEVPDWSPFEKIAFRFAFIFIGLLVIPVKLSWYKELFPIKSLYDLLSKVAGYRPSFLEVASESGKWGLASFSTWGIAALIGLGGAAIWTILVRNKKIANYNLLYYWLRVITRYRVAIGIIAFGYLKLYPMQMPFPSITNLNTELGDYAQFKLYWQAVGVSLWYQIFLGLLEIGAGVLMFFRATTALGAILNAGVLYNIAHANIAYDGGVHVYSGYFVLLSAFLLVYYAPAIWKLFIKKENVKPNYYYPKLKSKGQKLAFYGSKYLFIFLFVFVYGYYRYDLHYNSARLKEPVIPGLPNAEGNYEVSSFALNGDTIPYTPQDSVRWHSAIFERYSTLAYKVHKAFKIDISNGVPQPQDILRKYELTGRAGGWRYLYYEIDSANHQIYLVDKNQEFSKKLFKGQKDVAVGLKKLYKTAIRDSIGILKWDYKRPVNGEIIIDGLINKKDTVHIVLNKFKKDYPLGQGWYTKNNLYTYVNN